MTSPRLPRLALLLLALLAACGPAASPGSATAPASSPPPAAPTTAGPPPTPQVGLADPKQTTLPAVEAYRARIAAALTAPPYVLLREDLDAEAQRAQQLATDSEQVQGIIRSTASREPQRAEVFGVEPAGEGMVPPDLAAVCNGRRCYRVVIYLFATNTTLTAIVEAESGAFLGITTLEGVQADVPPDLADLATQIAISSPATADALGMEPGETMALMAATKSALNNTLCERSRHLCVAPTFPWGEGDRGALWVVVDLTEFRVVGVQWTDTGESSQRAIPPPTEASLQNEALNALCDQAQPLTWGDWSLEYVLTPSDGLEVRNATYQGRPALLSGKIVDWHVSYSTAEGFGYADGTGCPSFSSSSVLPLTLPSVRELVAEGDQPAGVVLEQEFRSDQWPQPCNYYYVSRFTFFEDGSFRVEGENRGRGCGTNGIYRPIVRVQLAGEQHQVAAWDGSGWQPWGEEQWAERLPDAPSSPEGYALRVEAPDVGGWGVDLGWDEGLAEQAYLYATRASDAEGAADLPTIGSCCAQGPEQGPELFIGPPNEPGGPPEALGASPVTLWYVPRISNEERIRCWADARLEGGVLVPEVWPCAAGPRFVPLAAP